MDVAEQLLEEALAKGLTIASIKVNYIHFGGIEIHNPDHVALMRQILKDASDVSRPYRFRKGGTRYPEPLGMASPARKLSIETYDYLRFRGMKGLSESAQSAAKRTLRLLFAVCGDIYVSAITHAHIYKLWDLIRWTPDGRASTKRLAELTADQLIDEGKALNVRTPAAETFRLYQRQLKTFFSHLVRAGAIAHSPMAAFDGMKESLVEDPNKPDRHFDSAELQRIFDPAGFATWAKSPHRWWCPILGLHMGMRIGEVAQLKLANIIENDGFWCIDIRATIDEDLRDAPARTSRQRLKGQSAIRCLPIPQAVLDAGFLDFVEDIRQADRVRLFPNLTAGTKKSGATKASYGACFSQQFSKYMAKLGFPRGVRFHAFRHTLITDLKQQGFLDRDVALVTGHIAAQERIETIKRHYDHSTSPKRRATKPVIREWQKEVLDAYQPPVALPKYQRGQFKDFLKWDGLVHP